MILIRVSFLLLLAITLVARNDGNPQRPPRPPRPDGTRPPRPDGSRPPRPTRPSPPPRPSRPTGPPQPTGPITTTPSSVTTSSGVTSGPNPGGPAEERTLTISQVWAQEPNGLERTASVSIPATSAGQKVPVVFHLHGNGG